MFQGEVLHRVQRKEEAEGKHGSGGAHGPEHPGPEVSQGLPVRHRQPRGVQSRVDGQTGISGYLAKGCVGWTKGTGQEVLLSSDRPPQRDLQPPNIRQRLSCFLNIRLCLITEQAMGKCLRDASGRGCVKYTLDRQFAKQTSMH